jgi:DNA-binding NtrC family response regulator
MRGRGAWHYLDETKRPIEDADVRRKLSGFCNELIRAMHEGRTIDLLALQEELELRLVLGSIMVSKGSRTAAARRLGINRTTLVAMLARLKRDAPRASSSVSPGQGLEPRLTCVAAQDAGA